MSSVTEGNLGLNYGWAYGESGWNTGMDDNLVKLGFTSRNQVKGILSAPPSTPSNGDAYIVGTSPTGLFSGNFGKVAIWDRTVWLFLTPKNHEVVYNVTNGCDYKYDNGWILKQEDELSPYVKVKDFTFSTGYTITGQRQCLLNLADNKYYQWFGALPKVVAKGSTPTTSGGIGAGAWVDRTDVTLRSELSGTDGAGLIGSMSYAQLRSYAGDKTTINVWGINNIFDLSAGDFKLNASDITSADNGGTILVDALDRRWYRILTKNECTFEMFCAVGDGVTDDTVAVQKTITFASSSGFVIKPNARSYLITSSLNVYENTQIIGTKYSKYGIGFGVSPKATNFIFTPSVSSNCFNLVGTLHGVFRINVSIQNVLISNRNGLGVAAINVDHGIYGVYKNISVFGFSKQIICNGTIGNTFSDCFLGNGANICLEYSGNYETTDVWDKCTFFGATVAHNFLGASIGVRFVNCLFEQILDAVAIIPKEAQVILYENCYSEDVCYNGLAASSVFRVGKTGSVLTAQAHLIINGGLYQGKNTGGVGAFIDSDYCTGIIISNIDVARFTDLIKTTSNTIDRSIVCSNIIAKNIINTVNNNSVTADFAKIAGSLQASPIGGSSGNAQRAYYHNITSSFDVIFGRTCSGPTLSLTGGATGVAGAITLGNGTSTTVGAAGGASTLPASPLGYLVAFVGTTQVKIPYYTT